MRDKRMGISTDDTGPLVHYRKKDAARVQQMDEMQKTVEEKVREVMDSFRESPSHIEVLEKQAQGEKAVMSGKPLTRWHLVKVAGYGLLAFGALSGGIAYLFFF